jgi:flagellin FlaB
VDIVNITVGLLAGSPGIDMDNVLISISDGNKQVTLEFDSTATTPQQLSGNKFGAVSERDMNPENWDTDHVMTQGDIVKIFINVTNLGMSLDPQSHVTIQLIPKHGVPTYVEFMVPATLTTHYVDLY